MKTTENYLAEIKEIRKMMEESSRFLSLSGLSGILIGIYALIGSYIAYRMIYNNAPSGMGGVVNKLVAIAFIVMVLSFITVLWLTNRRVKKTGRKIWNPGSKLMFINLAIPLISGGLLILIFTFRGVYDLISPACLVFYGLALVNAAKFTRQEIFFMGILQVALGIVAALIPSLALLMWAAGFGVIHIFYGALMYFRYEHKTN